MIRVFSKAKDGNTKLSESFRVREFACHDGSDTVKVDIELVKHLQRIRNWAGTSVIISSGYRTPSHNAKIGGASKSKHIYGMAADIYVKDRKKTITEIARYAEAIGCTGIERNEDANYVHIDTRPVKHYWRRSGGRNIDVPTFGGECPFVEPTVSLQRAAHNDGVRWLQWWLNLWGYGLLLDGWYGAKTEDAVKDVQKRRGLKPDGITGPKTRAALKGY